MRTLLVFLFRGVLRDKLLRKLRSATRPQHQTSATCNAKLSTIARQVAEKIAQCNRALSGNLIRKKIIDTKKLLRNGLSCDGHTNISEGTRFYTMKDSNDVMKDLRG